jgi:hypothetical protein
MGRQNSRGLELSFKPAKGGRGRGRWYKKFKGQAIYFGWGDGVTDRVGYRAALATYRQWLANGEVASRRPEAAGLTRRLQSDFSVAFKDPRYINLPQARQQISRLGNLGGTSAALFRRLADTEEKPMDVGSLDRGTHHGHWPDRGSLACHPNTSGWSRGAINAIVVEVITSMPKCLTPLPLLAFHTLRDR